jgi:hypothetical protein
MAERRAACRSSRRSATEPGRESLKPEGITPGAETGDQPDGQVGKHRVPTLSFPGENVAQVDFDEYRTNREKRIAEGQTGVGQGRGIDQRSVHPSPEPLHRFDQLTFVVGLHPFEVDTQPSSLGSNQGLDFSQGRGAVELRLAGPEKVEIGSIQHRNQHSARETLEPLVELLEIVLIGIEANAAGPGRGGLGGTLAEEFVKMRAWWLRFLGIRSRNDRGDR